MVSDDAFPSSAGGKRSTSPHFYSSIAKRIFSDVGGDMTIEVDGQSILLPKLLLISRSARIRRMVATSRDPYLSRLELLDVPGGSEAFELAAKFCYGSAVEITAGNVAKLRCVAEYLEMTEDHREENLVARTEAYLNEVVLRSVEKSVEVLCSCEELHPLAEDLGIVDRCVEAIAFNAGKDQLVSGFSRLDCDASSERVKVKQGCQERWVEDLSALRIDLYEKVITAMRKSGVKSDSIVASLIHYAQSYLRDIGKSNSSESGLVPAEEHRSIVETLVTLLVSEEISSVPLTFLFGILRMAIVVDASLECRLELEKRIGSQLETVTLDDLLIPSLQSSDSLFDVDTVHRILVNFLQRIEEEEDEDEDDHFKSGYESEGLGLCGHDSVLKVGRLLDSYLAEIASDPYLKLQKFIAMAELLPDYARVVDDGLYRAVDLYLKAHPFLTEPERNKLCKLIDCQKLSEEASDHAAQNDRLPVQISVRILYFEQRRLRSAVAGGAADGLFFSQRMFGSSGAPSAAVSPRDNYASLRRENRELKLEISRIRVRLSELEKEQELMRRGASDHHSSGQSRRAFFSSFSKGISFFGNSRASSHRQPAAAAAAAVAAAATEGKNRRHRRTR